MYESRRHPPLSKPAFLRRLAIHIGMAVGLVVVSLAIGTAGYMAFAKMELIDAFLDAAMLLGGMGPVGKLETYAGKLFAALFALYAGLVFLAVAGLVLAPILHRLLHKFHFDEKV